MFHLQSIIWSETCCGKNAEAAENSHPFQLWVFFQRSVTHSRVEREAHQAVAIKVEMCCVRVRNFSNITCMVLVLLLLYKIL
jgi:hypothetical protein